MLVQKNAVFMSFDVESIGLYGEVFAIAYSSCDRDGQEIDKGYYSCPSESAKGSLKNREWVAKNVLPHLPQESQYKNPDELCEAVYGIWMDLKSKYKKEGKEVFTIVDCGYPVEMHFFMHAIKMNEEKREFTGPLPLHEVATALLIAGIKREEYPRMEHELPEHHPLNDARYSARLFLTALKKNQEICKK